MSKKNKKLHLFIHCSATPEGRDVKGDAIRRFHTAPPPAGNGWRQVGYTDLILLDGTVERLVENNEDGYVDPWEVTNGAAGWNSNSRHICIIGGVTRDGKTPKDTRTPAQLEALKNYVLDFLKRFPDVKVGGHWQLAAKACPSFDTTKWLRSIGVPDKNIFKPEMKYTIRLAS